MSTAYKLNPEAELSIRPLQPTIGAEISGVDLRHPISDAVRDEIKSTLLKNTKRDEKIANIKAMEREINEFRQTREQQLQQQAMRMREGIVKEITDVVLERVKTNGMDLVFDKSGQSTNYVPVVLYSRDTADFTTEIITALNKKAASAPEKPATTSASPAKPATKP